MFDQDIIDRAGAQIDLALLQLLRQTAAAPFGVFQAQGDGAHGNLMAHGPPVEPGEPRLALRQLVKLAVLQILPAVRRPTGVPLAAEFGADHA